MPNKLSIKRIGLVVALVFSGCTTQLPFGGESMPPNQVATFIKVVTPRSAYDTPPRFRSGFAPFFPPTMIGTGRWGYAELDFAVQPDGSTADFRMIQATAPDFAFAAAIAVQKWKFSPALKNGRPVRVRVRLPFTFR